MKIIYPFTHSFLDYPADDFSCISIYFVGCEHNCFECSAKDLQDPNYESENTSEVTKEHLLELIENEVMELPKKRISLMGGDPCHPVNIETTKYLLKNLKNIEICLYTGYDISYIVQNKIKGFTFLKSGIYDIGKKQISKKTDDYIQFASTNQKLYNKDYNLISKDGRYYFE